MKTKLIFGVLSGLFLLDVAFAIPMSKTQAEAPSASQNEKYDGDCTGDETEGRCADKCPTGSYSMGYGQDGQLICRLEPTGCPYADSVPLGAECDKLAPEQASITPEVSTDELGGK